jgi:AbrB family looped-hinge helix DNA binding protein
MAKVDDAKYHISPEIKGEIIGVRKVHDRGRVQIPKKVRVELRVKDGDGIYWIKYDEKYYVTKAVVINE